MRRDALPPADPTLIELRAIRALLQSIDARLAPPTPADAGDLLRAIYAAIGDKAFAASELVVLAQMPQASALREAIGVLNARRLGKRLQEIEGEAIGGLTVLRTGVDSAGIVWRVDVI